MTSPNANTMVISKIQQKLTVSPVINYVHSKNNTLHIPLDSDLPA